MLGCQATALPSTKQIVSNWLGSINTTYLELLFWRARPDSPTSFSQYLPRMASLKKGSVPPCGRQSYYNMEALYFVYFHFKYMVQLYKDLAIS